MPVGQKLEEARKRKGVSLREVSESTKIRGDYLSAIETGNYEINLPEVYLRGFVRLYSKFLGLDQDAMVADLNVEIGKTSERTIKKSLGSIVSQDNLENKDRTSVKNQQIAPNKSSSSRSNLNLTLPIILSFVGVFIVLAVIFTIYLNKGEDEFSGENSGVESTINEVVDQNQQISSDSATSRHILEISVTGDMKKLIICDEGKSPPVFHEFDSLKEGWKTEISFIESFRCYSSEVEKVIISVDGEEPRSAIVDRSGIGTFSWKAN